MPSADGGCARSHSCRSMKQRCARQDTNPGVVLPSSLAALAALDSTEPVLAACLSGLSLTTSITSEQDLLLYRTLDLPEDKEERLGEVQRDIAVAAAYYEDKLATRARQLHYGGNWRGAGL